MAIISEKSMSAAATGLANLPIFRQFILMIGLAGSIAMGVGVVLWSQEPNFRPLYSNLEPEDSSQIIDALQKANIEYRINSHNGTILVPGSKVYQARIELAEEGLPNGLNKGFGMLHKKASFGTSRFMETARYRHALEGELSRTISSIAVVRSARVHLAIPKRTAFSRNAIKPTASVLVDLYSGRRLEPSQIAAISNIVAASVPNLSISQVTVVDREGRLLSEGSRSDELALANRQMQYIQQIEQRYVKNIDDLLNPLLGDGHFKAQVSVDMDFTRNERTMETFNPKDSALRSEQIRRQSRGEGQTTTGIPGQLQTSPPEANTKAKQRAEGEGPTLKEHQSDSSQESIRNYEVAKTISHTSQQPWRINRLTVALVIDDQMKVNKKSGRVSRKKRSTGEIAYITNLVKNAIGFDAKRGDKVEVINSSFAEPLPMKKMPPVPVWKEPWVWDLGKQLLGGIFILILLFGVFRPLFRGLIQKGNSAPQPLIRSGDTGEPVAPIHLAGNTLSYDQQVEVIQKLAQEDPKRVLEVVKSWVGDK